MRVRACAHTFISILIKRHPNVTSTVLSFCFSLSLFSFLNFYFIPILSCSSAGIVKISFRRDSTPNIFRFSIPLSRPACLSMSKLILHVKRARNKRILKNKKKTKKLHSDQSVHVNSHILFFFFFF